jgi:hypothetical protein
MFNRPNHWINAAALSRGSNHPTACRQAKTQTQPIVGHTANTAAKNSLAPPIGIMDCSSFHQPCGWLSPRFVLQRRLNDGANDLAKYSARSILLMMVSSSAFGASQATQCFSIEKNVRANGNG